MASSLKSDVTNIYRCLLHTALRPYILTIASLGIIDVRVKTFFRSSIRFLKHWGLSGASLRRLLEGLRELRNLQNLEPRGLLLATQRFILRIGPPPLFFPETSSARSDPRDRAEGTKFRVGIYRGCHPSLSCASFRGA